MANNSIRERQASSLLQSINELEKNKRNKKKHDAGSREVFGPKQFLTEFGHHKAIMGYYLGINIELWLDKSPMKNYRNSRGI